MVVVQKTITIELGKYNQIIKYCSDNQIAFSRFLASSAIKEVEQNATK